MKRSTIIICFMLALAPALSGCAGVIIGGAATAGLAAYDERGIAGVAQDTATATKIRASMLDRADSIMKDVGIEVYEGRALLTGRVPSEEMRADAVQLAWKVENVKDVINEIVVSPNPLSDIANDSWISAQLKTKITFDQDVLAVNYAIETVGGVVYLIGIAQNQAELDRVTNHARNIKYVQRVVSHVRVKAPAAS